MLESLRVDVVVAPGPELAAVRSLWREYWDSLGFPREFQSFAEELRTLPGVYGRPEVGSCLPRLRTTPQVQLASPTQHTVLRSEISLRPAPIPRHRYRQASFGPIGA